MGRRLSILMMAAFVTLDRASVARAGMPSVTLTDVARMRVQAISFFLLGFLACSWVVQRTWNSLARDFPRLPRLSFGRALGLVTLWGLLFVLVLTMISGARELMTPGAWRKEGLTYKLADAPPPPAADRHEAERRLSLDRLRVALWTYARGHDGRFPTEADARAAIPEEAWRLPDPSGMRYLYVAGSAADRGEAPLAYEPGLFGAERLVLLTDGRIVALTAEEIRRRLDAGRSR
jgi:hypothetical protein